MKAQAKLADPVAYLRQALAEDAFAVFCQPICALGNPLTYPMAERAALPLIEGGMANRRLPPTDICGKSSGSWNNMPA